MQDFYCDHYRSIRRWNRYQSIRIGLDAYVPAIPPRLTLPFVVSGDQDASTEPMPTLKVEAARG